MPDDQPTHAYVPGLTPRHPEGTFDSIRGTAKLGMSTQDLAQCAAFRIGLRYIEEGFFWEAHELLEPVWMALPEPSPERRLVQGLIQIANGFLKRRMGRPKAARRLAAIARELVPTPVPAVLMEVDCTDVHRRIDSLEADAN